MPLNNPAWTAEGDINPARFVKVGTGAFGVLEASAGTDVVVGISQEGSRDAPQSGASALAATTGKSIMVFGQGDVCNLQMSATCAMGALIRPTTGGKGVTSAVSGSAIALEPCTAIDNKIRVQVLIGLTKPV